MSLCYQGGLTDRQDRAPGGWIYLFILLVVLQCYTLTAIIFQVVTSGDLQQQP